MNGHNENGNEAGGHLSVAGHSNIHIIPHTTSHRIKESGKVRWQRFLHGGKWQVRVGLYGPPNTPITDTVKYRILQVESPVRAILQLMRSRKSDCLAIPFYDGSPAGAAYISLSGIYWHPDWLTVIEYDAVSLW